LKNPNAPIVQKARDHCNKPMSAISFFEEKQVHRAWNPSEEKWYFSIDDVVLALTDSAPKPISNNSPQPRPEAP
jgi:hypothetical protein